MRTFAVLVLGFALIGCAIHSGVVQMGPGRFMVSRQAATGFTGQGKLKAEAIREAGQFCTKQGKTVSVLNVTEAQPPFVFGNFPKVDLEFECVE